MKKKKKKKCLLRYYFRGKPEAPHINRGDEIEDEAGSGIIVGDSGTEFDVSWHIPLDNGVPIDLYIITLYRVRGSTIIPPVCYV